MKFLSSAGLLALAMLGLLALSCNDDDDDNTPSNQFTFDGSTFELGQGFLEDYGDNGNNSFDFDVTLTSPDIDFNFNTGEATGTGSGVYLDLNSPSEEGLVNGTYEFGDERDAFVMVDGEVFTNFDFEAGTGQVISVVDRTVELTEDDGVYSISFELTTSSNETISGTYNGELTQIF